MRINYWNCSYADPEECGEGENREWSYGCTHPDSGEGHCSLDNKYGNRKADCLLVIVLCPLCVAEHLTTRFHEGAICWCCLCKSCGVPMVVLKRHNIKPASEELDHMLKVLNEAALRHFGSQRYWIDKRRRQIPDHYHLHARRVKSNDPTDS